MSQAPTYVMGDIHGQLDKAERLLLDAGLVAGLEAASDAPIWAGGTSNLVFLGDFFDRGPDGLGAVDLVRRLQVEAETAGGRVYALLGNHELLNLGAYYIGDTVTPMGIIFRDSWLRNGGQPDILDALTPDHLAWVQTLPTMLLLGDNLLMHADALFYQEYGHSVNKVNSTITAILAQPQPAAWDRLLGHFNQRKAFLGTDGATVARRFLEQFGGKRIVHGHTTISSISRQADADIKAPLVYADGLCVNCDGGMYRGGPGFLYRLPE